MNYSIEQENFTGPLDLLLQLIQKRKLDICDISLAQVTQDYLHTISQKDLSLEQVHWFLDITARLILVKSFALLPHEPTDTSEATEDTENLSAQLLELARHKQRASDLQRLMLTPYVTRVKLMQKKRVPTAHIEIGELAKSFQAAIAGMEQMPKKAIRLKRVGTISLQRKLLALWSKNTELPIEAITNLGKSRYIKVVFFSLILQFIKEGKATIRRDSQILLVKLLP